jgi:hypothetical protein
VCIAGATGAGVGYLIGGVGAALLLGPAILLGLTPIMVWAKRHPGILFSSLQYSVAGVGTLAAEAPQIRPQEARI